MRSRRGVTLPAMNAEKLDKLVREDYFAREAVSKAVNTHCAGNRYDDPAHLVP